MTAAFAAVVVAVTACHGRDDLDGRRRPVPGLTEPASGSESAAPDVTVHYDLLDNRLAASVLASGALVIDPVLPTIARLGDGQWRQATVDGKRAALVDGIGAQLTVPIDFDPGGISRTRSGEVRLHLWARPAKPGQLVSVLIDERRVGDIAMPEVAWKHYALDLPADSVQPGESTIRLYFRHVGEIEGTESAAAIGRVALGLIRPADGPVVTAGARTVGDERRAALSVAGPARLSFYMYLPRGRTRPGDPRTPRGPRLVMSTAGGPKVRLAVRVARDGAQTETLWEGAGSSAWSPAGVSLADFAGQTVRLDLESSGPADWARPQVVSDSDMASPGAASNADHVILWVVSSLRADRIELPDSRDRAPRGAAPDKSGATPSLVGETPEPPGAAMSRFARSGAQFSRAVTNAGTSGAAHAALMTGRHIAGEAVPDTALTLGQRFQEAGFATALISGNGFVRRDAGFARGFDLYENPLRRRQPHGAKLLWQSARKFLSRRKDGHVFVLIASSEPHLPYTPSEESFAVEGVTAAPRIDPARTADLALEVRAGKRTLTADERNHVRALYDAEVRDADSAFGEMLADLSALGIADRTAVVLVADHGQEMFERGAFGHGHSLYAEIRDIPLAISAPGLGSTAVDDVAVELVDVYPTVLALAGVSANPEVQGENLVPYARGATSSAPRPVFSSTRDIRAVTIGSLELIEGKSSEFYDRSADPSQQTNLIESSPIAARMLRNALGLHTAYRDTWSRRRWGTVVRMTEAFAADHGL